MIYNFVIWWFTAVLANSCASFFLIALSIFWGIMAFFGIAMVLEGDFTAQGIELFFDWMVVFLLIPAFVIFIVCTGCLYPIIFIYLFMIFILFTMGGFVYFNFFKKG